MPISRSPARLTVLVVSRFRRAISGAIALGSFLVAARADALDRFEIQVYDGAGNAPGSLTLENHVNFTPRGHATSDGPEAPGHRQAHWTYEGALGVLPFWEPGVYLQTAILPDGGYTYAGAKIRSKFFTPAGWHPFLRFGVNQEIAAVPTLFDRDRWSSELRPIAAIELPRFRAAVNPIVGFGFSSEALRAGPSFEPAASAAVRVTPDVSVGFEYYADIGPIAHPAPLTAQAHYLYAAGDAHLASGWDLNLGVGYGLTEASERWTVKMILDVEIASLWSRGDGASHASSQRRLAGPHSRADLRRQ